MHRRRHAQLVGLLYVAQLISINAAKPVCLLLLGSSRHRQLYAHLQLRKRICLGHTCTSMPWSGCGPLSGNPAPDMYGNFPVQASALCKADPNMTALSYFSHYGVANDTYHIFKRPEGHLQGWASHVHLRWDGPGWDVKDMYPHSPKLIWEAARRFTAAYNDSTCRRRIVFCSFLWDVARYQNHLQGTDLEAWGTQYARNLSVVLAPLTALPLDRLFLEVPFLTGDEEVVNIIRGSHMFDHMRHVASALSVPILDTTGLGFRAAHPNAEQSAAWWRHVRDAVLGE